MPDTTLSSRFLHFVDRRTSRAGTACGIAVAVVLFVIRHTQSREQTATQMKLDELIRAMPQADDHLVHIEAASDHELIEREQRDLEHHGAVRDAT